MKTNLNLVAAEIIRRLDDLRADKANAEAVVLSLIKPIADDRDAALKPQMNTDKTQILQEPWPLSEVRQKTVLRNAINLIPKKERRGVPLWSLVSSLTNHGSGYSREICAACGWNPDQDGHLFI